MQRVVRRDQPGAQAAGACQVRHGTRRRRHPEPAGDQCDVVRWQRRHQHPAVRGRIGCPGTRALTTDCRALRMDPDQRNTPSARGTLVRHDGVAVSQEGGCEHHLLRQLEVTDLGSGSGELERTGALPDPRPPDQGLDLGAGQARVERLPTADHTSLQRCERCQSGKDLVLHTGRHARTVARPSRISLRLSTAPRPRDVARAHRRLHDPPGVHRRLHDDTPTANPKTRANAGERHPNVQTPVNPRGVARQAGSTFWPLPSTTIPPVAHGVALAVRCRVHADLRALGHMTFLSRMARRTTAPRPIRTPGMSTAPSTYAPS